MESTFTGYCLHNRGWRSVYLYPKRPCFLGCTTIDMKDALVQLIKWSSGLLQVGLSKFSPMTYGLSNTTMLQSLCYGYFTFMPLFSVPCLLYGIISPLCFLTGIPLFPKVHEPPPVFKMKSIISFHHGYSFCRFQAHGLQHLLGCTHHPSFNIYTKSYPVADPSGHGGMSKEYS